MGRHPIHGRRGEHGFPGGPGGADPTYCEWGVVVGDRIRRLRKDRDMTLNQFALTVYRPEGGSYSAGYFSRIERGWASAPLYVYLAIAHALDVEPGALLGSDDVQKEVSDAEMTLIRCLRRLHIAPDDALVRLTTTGAAGG
jgi:transcriptional regulator with XRE-family HTH domain